MSREDTTDDPVYLSACDQDPLGGREFFDIPSLHQCFASDCWAVWGCEGFCLRQIFCDTGKTRSDIPWGEAAELDHSRSGESPPSKLGCP